MNTLSQLFGHKLHAQLNLNFRNEGDTWGMPGWQESYGANPDLGFGALLTRILGIALLLVGLILLFMLIWGGLEWMLAGGDSSKIQKARDRITNAIVGLVVLLSVAAIMLLLQSLLGVCIVDFNGTCAAAMT